MLERDWRDEFIKRVFQATHEKFKSKDPARYKMNCYGWKKCKYCNAEFSNIIIEGVGVCPECGRLYEINKSYE